MLSLLAEQPDASSRGASSCSTSGRASTSATSTRARCTSRTSAARSSATRPSRSASSPCAARVQARRGVTLTSLLGIRHPIVQAPMAHVQPVSLAAAVSEAGALGSIAGAPLSPDALRAAIRERAGDRSAVRGEPVRAAAAAGSVRRADRRTAGVARAAPRAGRARSGAEPQRPAWSFDDHAVVLEERPHQLDFADDRAAARGRERVIRRRDPGARSASMRSRAERRAGAVARSSARSTSRSCRSPSCCRPWSQPVGAGARRRWDRRRRGHRSSAGGRSRAVQLARRFSSRRSARRRARGSTRCGRATRSSRPRIPGARGDARTPFIRSSPLRESRCRIRFSVPSSPTSRRSTATASTSAAPPRRGRASFRCASSCARSSPRRQRRSTEPRCGGGRTPRCA